VPTRDASLSLARRRDAIVAALRAVADEPLPAATASASGRPQQAGAGIEAAQVDRLEDEIRRLAVRLERLEGKVDLIQDGDDEPLSWPLSIRDGDGLGVPPLDLRRSTSPAFDVLLGRATDDQ
jgi:hypothetical protein